MSSRGTTGGVSRTTDDPLRFRPHARRRNRIAAGVALGAIAIGGNVLAYTSIDDAEPVVQAVRDIPAGDVIRSDMLRVVDIELDDAVNAVPGERLDSLVGSYAKVRIVSGSLVVHQALQPDPLVEPGRAVVALVIPPAELPVGLRERVPIQVVIPPRTSEGSIDVVDATTVGLPADVGNTLGERSVSVEVAVEDAAVVAAAEDVRIVLIESQSDADTSAGRDTQEHGAD